MDESISQGINLLRGRQKGQLLRERKLLRALRIVSIVLLLLVCFFSGFLFFFATRSSLPPLKKEEETLLSNLSTLHTKAVKLLLTQNRVKEIAGIIEKKSSFDKIIDTMTQSVPKNVSVQSFALDKKSVTMTIASSSLSPIDTMFNGLENMVRNKIFFSKLTLDSLDVNTKTGQYIISVSLNVL